MLANTSISSRRVVVLGGGIAALEAVLALHVFGEGRLQLTLIAPNRDFHLRPLDAATPFTRGRQERLPLADFMSEHGGRFRRTAVLQVDPQARLVQCAVGDDEPYDALVVAVGGISRPAFDHVWTFGSDPNAFGGLLLDLEQGWSRSVAFVVPRGCSWPLPLYELALMTAERVWDMGMDGVRLHVVTPEDEPLEVFGSEGSRTVRELLRRAGISFHGGADPRVTRAKEVLLDGPRTLECDRIVALPVIEGPRLVGLPSDEHGFIPVDPSTRAVDAPNVFAVGDVADHAVKQGGLACQQADVAAREIAADAGAGIERLAYEPVLRGRLLNAGRDRFLRRGGGASGSRAADEPLWWPPAKVSGRHLAPYLERRGLVHLPLREADRGTAVAAPRR